MINSFFQGILDWLRSTYLEPSLKILKLRAAIYYLEGVKGARRILILICLLVFAITLIGASLVLIPIALLLFMPWEPTTKAIVGVVIGGVYLLVPAIALISLLSDKRWMRITGATTVLNKLVDL
ncbi:MAG: hypothetical protein PHR28_05930 [candidate division Zixibacteria bacterium]|nr:hypothetical protein [candidate division Zixibacteria bacterium]